MAAGMAPPMAMGGGGNVRAMQQQQHNMNMQQRRQQFQLQQQQEQQNMQHKRQQFEMRQQQERARFQQQLMSYAPGSRGMAQQQNEQRLQMERQQFEMKMQQRQLKMQQKRQNFEHGLQMKSQQHQMKQQQRQMRQQQRMAYGGRPPIGAVQTLGQVQTLGTHQTIGAVQTIGVGIAPGAPMRGVQTRNDLNADGVHDAFQAPAVAMSRPAQVAMATGAAVGPVGLTFSRAHPPVERQVVQLLPGDLQFKAAFRRFPNDRTNGWNYQKHARRGQQPRIVEVFTDQTITVRFNDGTTFDLPWEAVTTTPGWHGGHW